MIRVTFLLLVISLSASFTSDFSTRRYFVVWNVGQGQWTTWTDAFRCLHFDRGGEFFPQRKAVQLCRYKEQRIFLSHWDWDHVGGIGALAKTSCVEKAPLGRSSSRKEKLLAKLKACEGATDNVTTWNPLNAKNSNARSQVFLLDGILIPGDSPTTEEIKWSHEMKLQNVEILVLGHHGSRTSTSEELLLRLPRLQHAVSSARWRRYKHPHAEVVARLQKAHVPLLRTEDWGNIWFEL